MYKFIYVLTPKNYKNWIERHIEYCDFTISPIKLIGFMILFGLLLGFVIGFIPYVLNLLSLQFFLLVWMICFIAFELIMHGILVVIADGRANFVEEILPDALQIVSANMRSGLTVDKAILTSARPEFGPLEIELKKVAKEVLGGRSLEESLKMITRKIKSKLLDRTIGLLIEGMVKGGSLTTLLDSISDDIRQIRILRREIKSYVMMYGIFIFFAACFGAPLLYSVSTYLVETMTKFGGAADVRELFATTTAVPFFKFKITDITPDFLLLYSVLAISVTTIFGSLLIGLIQEGTEKAGLKFIPVLLSLGLVIFFLSRIVFRNIFGSFMI